MHLYLVDNNNSSINFKSNPSSQSLIQLSSKLTGMPDLNFGTTSDRITDKIITPMEISLDSTAQN